MDRSLRIRRWWNAASLRGRRCESTRPDSGDNGIPAYSGIRGLGTLGCHARPRAGSGTRILAEFIPVAPVRVVDILYRCCLRVVVAEFEAPLSG